MPVIKAAHIIRVSLENFVTKNHVFSKKKMKIFKLINVAYIIKIKRTDGVNNIYIAYKSV